MSFTLNLTEDEAKPNERSGSNAPMPKGNYDATIFEAEVIEKNGTSAYSVQYRISGPTHENRRLFDNFIPLDSHSGAFFRTKDFLAAVGSPLTAGENRVPKPGDLAGIPVSLYIAHQAYDAAEKKSYSDGGKSKDDFSRIKSIIDSGQNESISDGKGGTRDRYVIQERIAGIDAPGKAKPVAKAAPAQASADVWG